MAADLATSINGYMQSLGQLSSTMNQNMEHLPSFSGGTGGDMSSYLQQWEATLGQFNGSGSVIPGGAPAGQPAAGGNSDSGGAPAPTDGSQQNIGGQQISVDGAQPGGDSVNLNVVNNTGQNQTYAITNSQNQVVSKVTLPPGGKATFVCAPSDANTKSARLQQLNSDGSLKANPKLCEFNLTGPGNTAINVSNNNFAGVTGTSGGVDSTKILVADDQGQSVGDGGNQGHSYENSVDDHASMFFGQSPSKNWTITFS